MEAVEILTNSKSRKDYDLLVKAREYQRLRQREKRQREKKKIREIEEQIPQYWELEGSLNPSMPIDWSEVLFWITHPTRYLGTLSKRDSYLTILQFYTCFEYYFRAQ